MPHEYYCRGMSLITKPLKIISTQVGEVSGITSWRTPGRTADRPVRSSRPARGPGGAQARREAEILNVTVLLLTVSYFVLVFFCYVVRCLC